MSGVARGSHPLKSPTTETESAFGETLALRNGRITLDGNNPMAGRVARCVAEILSVRAATAEEIRDGFPAEQGWFTVKRQAFCADQADCQATDHHATLETRPPPDQPARQGAEKDRSHEKQETGVGQ